jgi:hypothetical protein
MSRFGNIGHRLYTGEVSYDFIGHRRLGSHQTHRPQALRPRALCARASKRASGPKRA